MFSEAGWNVYDFFVGKKKTFLPPSSSMQGVVSWLKLRRSVDAHVRLAGG
jgi:hypothetical protein